MPDYGERFHPIRYQTLQIDRRPLSAYLQDRSSAMTRFAKLLPVLAVFGATAFAAPDVAPTASPDPNSNINTKMTAADMNVASSTIEVRMETDAQEIVRIQDIAKRQKDVIKLNCVNDRLVQVKAQRNIADELRAQLGAAIAKNSDERFSLFAQLGSVSEQVKTLKEQARACIGETELLKQETSGVVVEHPDLPDDPTLIPPLEGQPIEPPGYASPFD